MKKKIPRWTGRPELWVNKANTKIVIRDEKIHAWLLDIEDTRQEWSFIAFKEMGSFDFFNGTKHLLEHGFRLIEKL